MRALIFGASGMVGQAVLRECLLDSEVTEIAAVVRSPLAERHPKLTQIQHADLFDLAPIESRLARFDACFFLIGVTSVGMPEAEYRRLTYDLTLSVARTLARLAPAMTFVYVSGAGTDSSGNSSLGWARIKGQTENHLLQLFPSSYMFRPGYIQPMHGIKARVGWYNAVYAVFGPLYPLWKKLAPNRMSTTEEVGRAMLRAAKSGAPKRVLEIPDINGLAAGRLG